MVLNLSPANRKSPINEEDLYNPNGIEIHYGYDGRAVYGYDDDYAYSAITQTQGLHGINLSRELNPGEKIRLHWRNNYDLIIFNPGDVYIVAWHPTDEHLNEYYEYDPDTKTYSLTEDSSVDPDKTYFYLYPAKTRVERRIGGSYQEIGKYVNLTGSSENTCPKFNDDVLTKRFEYIETQVYKEF